MSALHRLTLHNRRATPISLSNIQAVGVSVALGNDCPAALPPGAGCSIGLRASAGALGRAAGALEVATDAPGVLVRVPLSYEVTDGPSGRLSFSLPDALPELTGGAVLDFGSAPAQAVTVRLRGASPGTLKLQGVVTAAAPPATPPPAAAPDPSVPAAASSGGGVFSVAWLVLLCVATALLVIGRPRKRHGVVTRGS